MGEGEEEKGGSTPVTPTSTSALPSPLPSGAHNKKNFTFVHCQSQILKRRQGDGQSVQLYVSVRGVGRGKGGRVSHSLWAKKYISTRQVSAKQRKNTTATTTTTAASAAVSPLPSALHTHTLARTHARWLRAPFHWQRVDVVSVGFGRARAVTASKINARIILPTLLLLFLLLLWRALNPTHTLTHTHIYSKKIQPLLLLPLPLLTTL